MEKENLIKKFKKEEDRINITLDKRYESILPFRYKLKGDKEVEGAIGKTRKIIESDDKIDNKLKLKLWSILDNIEHLDRFHEVYYESLEKHIEVLTEICRESLGIKKVN